MAACSIDEFNSAFQSQCALVLADPTQSDEKKVEYVMKFVKASQIVDPPNLTVASSKVSGLMKKIGEFFFFLFHVSF
jgi:hypothetical protein